jgi:hypothetical protein
MIPWVNVVVPLTQILPELPGAIAGDKIASQRIVNELLITTGPLSFLYYGYDELADLANVEAEGQALKEEIYVNAWNILDPFAQLHVKGESGLET